MELNFGIKLFCGWNIGGGNSFKYKKKVLRKGKNFLFILGKLFSRANFLKVFVGGGGHYFLLFPPNMEYLCLLRWGKGEAKIHPKINGGPPPGGFY